MPSRRSLALTACLAVGRCAACYATEKPLSVCDALNHLQQKGAEHVVIRGVFVQYVHGAFLKLPSACSELPAVRALRSEGVRQAMRIFTDANHVANTFGAGILATFEGRLEWTSYHNKAGPLFSITSISEMQLEKK